MLPETYEFWQHRENRLHDRFRLRARDGRSSGSRRDVNIARTSETPGKKCRVRRLFLTAAACAAVIAPSAEASQLVDRNASGIVLAVNARGEALLTYRAEGRVKHVLAWGGINAIAPARGAQQQHFWLDYAGGWGKYHRTYWRGISEPLPPLFGPAARPIGRGLHRARRFVLGRSRRGSALPNFGGMRAPWGWVAFPLTGALAVLTVKQDWARRRWDHSHGSLRYAGRPVYGFHTSVDGRPLDRFGRLIYVDTFDSRHTERDGAARTACDASRFGDLLLRVHAARRSLRPGRGRATASRRSAPA